MLNTYKKYMIIILSFVVLAGCQDEKVSLKVGSKVFSESMILAEMIAQLAENDGIAVERKIPFGNTAKCLEGLKQGHLDIYPEYNGTSLIFLGQAPSNDSTQSTQTVNQSFKPMGLEMKDGFGFSNEYVMVMTPERSQELGVTKISDLAALNQPVTFSVEDDFLKRPADGLQQMNRRYGIIGSKHVVFTLGPDNKDKQIAAMLDGLADVGELYATDGQIAEYGLIVLEDDKQFFPVYDAAPLGRSEAMANIPALTSILGKLANAISTSDMQVMNKAVDLDAQTAASVAASFLVAKGLLPEGTAGKGADQLFVVADPSVKHNSTTAKALRAVRAGFSGKDIQLSNSPSPLESLASGSAQVAMVGAEAFYTMEGGSPKPKGISQAFAVLGYKTAHLIGLRYGDQSITKMKTIATGPEGSGSARVLEMILSSLGGLENTKISYLDSSIKDQVEGLLKKQYDAVFAMASLGDREIATALANAEVDLIGMDEWADGGHTAKFSYIRPATIPKQTYSALEHPVTSISTQLVLSSPVKHLQDPGEVGPGTTGTGDTKVVPVSGEAVQMIREAIGESDVIDPAIPAHDSLIPKIEVVDKSLPFSIHVSVANIVMILFLVWVIYLFTLPSPRKFTMDDK